MNFFRNIASNVLRGSSSQEASEAGGDGSPEAEVDDTDLVKQAQAGDYTAFDTLVTKHRGKVYAMIMNMVKNDADAWDLAQDSFIKAWKALPKFENRSKFSTWLFRISHNVVYDWMRKKKIRSEGEFDDEILVTNRIDMTSSSDSRQMILMVSRPQEPPLQPLAERYVNLSTHTAPIRQMHRSFLLANGQTNMDFALIFLPEISLLLSLAILK